MKVKMLGGCQVGASAALVEAKDADGVIRRILIDSGTKINADREGHLMPEDGVDLVLITHGHEDHVGNLWAVMNKYPEAIVKMTRPTVYITQIKWEDTDKILGRNSRNNPETLFLREQFTEGMSKAAKNLSIIEKPGREEIFPGIFATFQAAGHIQGATWILIEAESKTVLFSGDIYFQDTPTVSGVRMDELPTCKIDALFVDSTYGAKEAALRQDESLKMSNLTKEALKENRNVVVASLSFGRLPDIGVDFAEQGIDVYVDGLGRVTLDEALGLDAHWSSHERVIEHFEESAEENGGFRTLRVGAGKIRMIEDNRQREFLLNSSQPKVILAPSGMLAGGYSVKYFSNFLADPNALLFLTSYQAENTAGRALSRKSKGDSLTLFGPHEERIQVKIKADVLHANLNSHPGGSDIFNLLRHLRPERTFLVHGDDNAREELKTFLAERSCESVFIPQVKDEIEVN